MQVSRERFEKLRSLATEADAISIGRGLVWKISGKCRSPVKVSYTPTRSIAEGVIDLVVPCRHCSACLAARCWQWTVRAINEWARAERTWFATLTYDASHRRRFLRAFVGIDDPQARRRAMVKLAAKDMQKYIRALRKRGLKVRYLAVPEPSKDGTIHWHALLHGAGDLKWQPLARSWPHGFVKIKLVPSTEEKPIRYVTKYLAKGRWGRVMASRRYGLHALLSSTANHGAQNKAPSKAEWKNSTKKDKLLEAHPFWNWSKRS